MKLIKLLHLPPTEIRTCMKSIIIPTMTYGLSAMTQKSKDLEEIQRPQTHALLPNMGYNRHTPRAIVYNTTKLGGVGLKNLHTEQGISHIQYITRCWRCNNETTNTLRALIETYIVVSGLPTNPFEDVRQLLYMSCDWINTIQQFLVHINGRLYIKDINITKKWRICDKPVMEKAMRFVDNKEKLTAINNCRLYLQIMNIAEMTTTDGIYILKDAFHGIKYPTGAKGLNTHSRSTLHWPKQPKPPAKAWRIWKKWL
jgi:hypothetical protein